MISLDDVLAAAASVREAEAADPAVTVHLYVDRKWSAGRIAEHLGLHRSTIYRRLERAGVYRGPGRSGAPRQGRCKRNHDMAVHAKVRKDGSRFCTECKRIRSRIDYQPEGR